MLGNATVSVVATTTTRDKYGDSTTTTVTVPLPWAIIAPRSSTERADQTAPALITAATMYAPYDTELDADDVVRVSNHSPAFDGDWQVDGLPGPWASPFSTWRPGLEVALKRASDGS